MAASFVHEGLIGTHLRGRIASRLEKDEILFVVPVIEGKAWTTGRHEFIVENGDPGTCSYSAEAT